MTTNVLLVTSAVPNPNGQEALAEYGKGSGALIGQSGGKPVARFTVTEQLYGDTPAAFISIAEFPSGEVARDFFNSAEYQALVPARDQALSSVNIYFSQPGLSAENIGGSGKSILIIVAAPNPNEKEALGQYQQGAGPLFGKYGGKPVANISIAEQFHGDSPAAFVSIIEFPNDEAVKGVFGDEEYQKLIPLRDKALSSLNLYFVK